jgi:hypothetical protein
MKLEVTKAVRTFTLTLSEEEASVIMGVLGSICGKLPNVVQDLYNDLATHDVESVGALVESDGNVVFIEDSDDIPF